MRALVQVLSTGKAPETASESVAATLKEQAPKFTLERLARIAKRFIETEQHLKTSEGTPLPLELAVLDLVTASAPAAPPVSPQPSSSRSASSPTTAPRASSAAAPPPRTIPRAEARTAQAAGSKSDVIDLATRRAQSASLADVQRAWTDLVAQARAQSLGKAAHLLDAEPVSVDGATVVIGFATDFARAYWQDRMRAELEQGLSERLSLAIRVRCVTQPAGETASDDPMHRAALEIFRRPDRIMEIE